MPPPNEQWDLIKSLMDRIEQKKSNIMILQGNYDRTKALLATQGISMSAMSGGVSLSGASRSNQRVRHMIDDTSNSGSSANQ